MVDPSGKSDQMVSGVLDKFVPFLWFSGVGVKDVALDGALPVVKVVMLHWPSGDPKLNMNVVDSDVHGSVLRSRIECDRAVRLVGSS